MNLHLHISLTLPNKLITIYSFFIHPLVSVSGGSSVSLEVGPTIKLFRVYILDSYRYQL